MCRGGLGASWIFFGTFNIVADRTERICLGGGADHAVRG